jgi:hypothetical protein
MGVVNVFTGKIHAFQASIDLEFGHIDSLQDKIGFGREFF